MEGPKVTSRLKGEKSIMEGQEAYYKQQEPLQSKTTKLHTSR